jgi:hypothetical protein
VQVNEFLLEGCVEGLGRSVVEADPCLSYRRDDPVVKAVVAKSTAGVLAATIRVHYGFSLAWPAVADGHIERLDHHVFTHIVSDGPADELARVSVDHRGHIGPAICGMNICDGPVPYWVFLFRDEVALDEIHQAPSVRAGQSSSPGQAPDALGRHALALAGQLGVYSIDSVPSLIRFVDGDDESRELDIAPRVLGLLPADPRIEAGSRYMQHLAHEVDGIPEAARLASLLVSDLQDKGELY